MFSRKFPSAAHQSRAVLIFWFLNLFFSCVALVVSKFNPWELHCIEFVFFSFPCSSYFITGNGVWNILKNLCFLIWGWWIKHLSTSWVVQGSFFLYLLSCQILGIINFPLMFLIMFILINRNNNLLFLLEVHALWWATLKNILLI